MIVGIVNLCEDYCWTYTTELIFDLKSLKMDVINGHILFCDFPKTQTSKPFCCQNRNSMCHKASAGRVIKTSTESSNYELIEEKVWNFIFDCAEPKWQAVSSWKNNEPGMLAHHFGGSISLLLDSRKESGPSMLLGPQLVLFLYLCWGKKGSIMGHSWENSQVLHLMNAQQQSLDLLPECVCRNLERRAAV